MLVKSLQTSVNFRFRLISSEVPYFPSEVSTIRNGGPSDHLSSLVQSAVKTPGPMGPEGMSKGLKIPMLNRGDF
jgi:hypothetical protein